MAKRSTSSGSKSSAGSKTSTDHEEIRQWAESRGGKPACVKGTGGGGDTGLLRIEFPGFGDDEGLNEIQWDEFFEKFDDQGLALVFQEQTSDGQESRFNKLVSRETAARKSNGASKGRGGGKSASARTGGKSSGRASARGGARSGKSAAGASERKGAAKAGGRAMAKSGGNKGGSTRKASSAKSSRGRARAK